MPKKDNWEFLVNKADGGTRSMTKILEEAELSDWIDEFAKAENVQPAEVKVRRIS